MNFCLWHGYNGKAGDPSTLTGFGDAEDKVILSSVAGVCYIQDQSFLLVADMERGYYPA